MFLDGREAIVVAGESSNIVEGEGRQVTRGRPSGENRVLSDCLQLLPGFRGSPITQLRGPSEMGTCSQSDEVLLRCAVSTILWGVNGARRTRPGRAVSRPPSCPSWSL